MSQFQATRDPLINLSIQINDGQAVFSYSKDGEPSGQDREYILTVLS